MDGWKITYRLGRLIFRAILALGRVIEVNKGPFPKNPGEPRKKTSYFPLYWMVNRDPYEIIPI